MPDASAQPPQLGFTREAQVRIWQPGERLIRIRIPVMDLKPLISPLTPLPAATYPWSLHEWELLGNRQKTLIRAIHSHWMPEFETHRGTVAHISITQRPDSDEIQLEIQLVRGKRITTEDKLRILEFLSKYFAVKITELTG